MGMWKQKSVANELFEKMQEAQNLMVLAEDNKENIKLITALDELNKAAEVFIQSGQIAKAEQVTKMMKKLAQDTVLAPDEEGYTLPIQSLRFEDQIRDIKFPKPPKTPEDIKEWISEHSPEKPKEIQTTETIPASPLEKIQAEKEQAQTALDKAKLEMNSLFGGSLAIQLQEDLDSIEKLPKFERLDKYKSFKKMMNAVMKNEDDNSAKDRNCRRGEMMRVLKHYGFGDKTDKNNVFGDKDGNLRSHGNPYS
jgi:hypothetical protein